MNEESKLKECSFYLVRYVPDIVRGEGLNIGLFLHSPEQEYLDCLFTDDFSRVRRLHPRADVKFLRELQSYFEQQIREHEGDLEGYVREMQHSYSNLIQLTEQCACLASDPSQEIQELFTRYVGARTAGPVQSDTRMRVKHALTKAFERAGLIKLKALERHIPAQQWTEKGDPFTFDFGYTPQVEAGMPAEARLADGQALAKAGRRNGHIRLIHALSLKRDATLADLLALKIKRVREKEPADLTAVVEALPARGDKTADYSHKVLLDHQIAVEPLARLDAYVEHVRHELRV